MKRTLLLIYTLTLGFMLSSQAQTQRGYVKTLGRPGRPGEPLSGVTVRVKGAHNAMLSQDDGTFSIDMTGKKTGDAYALQQVSKTGYELNESDVIGRQFAYSEQVPLTLVMVSSAQLQADKQRIEANAYQAAERNYQQMYAELEKQLVDSIISAEKYREQLQALQDGFLNYQTLIEGLAEHYAHLDYDHLDEKEREISECIENGELERADSLLKGALDPDDILRRNMEAIAELERQIKEAQGIIDEANADMEAVLKQQAKDAEYLYQLYTIALSRYDNEKALYYIETRAALDTTNAEWQIDAGKFIKTFLANYKLAIEYFNKALAIREENLGKDHPDVGAVLANLGLTYQELGEPEIAMEYFLHSQDIALKAFGKESLETATVYNNLGSIHSYIGKYELALAYYDTARVIRINLLGEDHPELANSYGNIGSVYYHLSNFPKALEYFNRVIALQEQHPETDPLDLSISYNNLGSANSSAGNYELAMEYHHKSLALREKILGRNHPATAMSYNNIGNVYHHLKDYEKALEYYSIAYEIRLQTLGRNHPLIASSLNNIGSVLRRLGRSEEALEYLLESVNIRREILGDHPSVANTLNNIADYYLELENYEKALEYYYEVLAVRERVFGPESTFVAAAYCEIGWVYFIIEEYGKELECLFKALDIYRKAQGEDHYNVATVCYNLGKTYKEMGNNQLALEYFRRSLAIRGKVYGPDHPDTEEVRKEISEIE